MIICDFFWLYWKNILQTRKNDKKHTTANKIFSRTGRLAMVEKTANLKNIVLCFCVFFLLPLPALMTICVVVDMEERPGYVCKNISYGGCRDCSLYTTIALCVYVSSLSSTLTLSLPLIPLFCAAAAKNSSSRKKLYIYAAIFPRCCCCHCCFILDSLSLHEGDFRCRYENVCAAAMMQRVNGRLFIHIVLYCE
jgi:hypothetical protein